MASAAATTAICSGVTVSSPWPMARFSVSPSYQPFLIARRVSGPKRCPAFSLLRGIFVSEPSPKSRAYLSIASAFTFRPTL
ncbi:MAG: hypothetical protein A2V88_18105 [Elusimicrobia bacterium RBG_16_66_12]|nr:MAG: hypothetical protein A2V88_18105 [Elusimicrobia bacterium RBG_16_66_12]